MSRFVGKPIVEPVGDGVFWWVHQEFHYWSDLLGRRIVIPKGFKTDGASVPKVFQNILSPTGPYFAAGIVHDLLYRWQKFSRRQSDDALLEGMWVLRCKPWQYGAIYLAVRGFGWNAWRKDKELPLSARELRANQDLPIAG